MREFLKDLALRAGEISLEYRKRDGKLNITKKSAKDLVTEADIAIDKYIVSKIREKYPEHSIFGEESGKIKGNEYRWIIDPIDGTTSFAHDQPFYSISIGVERSGEMILGAVNMPAMNELFMAEKGKGATLNDEPIRVSEASELVESVLGTGFACLRANLEYNNLPFFNEFAPNIRGVRRFGSAAADLCYVACGRLDGFWEINLNIYDVAAGCLILSEAGGRITDFEGKPLKNCFEIVASNGHLHGKMVEVLSRVKREVQAGD